ncbi:MAG: ribosomal L7Ae/L30e/S12e/Gadd45 family protein [Clostridia bacterium]|nr:ribosomal L7Ae/L30e/S12e/Gadd45 family protein [Clostridia bacterium]
MNDRVTGLLGLARRAGKVAVGYDAALSAVRDGKGFIGLCACDLSPKSRKEWLFSVSPTSVPIRTLPLTKDSLGAVLGVHKPVGIITVCDEGFARAIGALCPESEEEETV